MYYEHHVRLAGIDVDGRGYCKASALLNHLQVAATLAAEEGALVGTCSSTATGPSGCWPAPGTV